MPLAVHKKQVERVYVKLLLNAPYLRPSVQRVSAECMAIRNQDSCADDDDDVVEAGARSSVLPV